MCGCVDDRREKFRTRCGVEWRRSIGAGTSRRIDSFGLQMIHRRSVYEPIVSIGYANDYLETKDQRSESKREVNSWCSSAPFVFDFVKFHFSLRFSPPFPLPSHFRRRLVDRDVKIAIRDSPSPFFPIYDTLRHYYTE